MSDLWGYGWRMGAYDFSAPHGEFQMPVERNEQGHVRVHRGVVVPRHELDNPDHFLHDYGVHWSTNEQISQALSDPAVYGEHDDDVGLLLSGWYDPAHGTHSDPDPITGGQFYNDHEQEITMPPGTPIHVDRARWKHPDWNHDRWEDLGWSPGHHTAARLAMPQGGWYHASPHELSVGTVLTPGGGQTQYDRFYDRTDQDRSGHVWVDSLRNVKRRWADPDHFIYQVEPHADPQLFQRQVGRGMSVGGEDGYTVPGATITKVVRGRTAALDSDLAARLHDEFHDWWGKNKDELFFSEPNNHGRGPLGHWPNIEQFLQDRYPAAHKDFDMGREQARHMLDRPQMMEDGYFTRYETGPDAVAKHGYDPAEVAAGMLLLHNQTHPHRWDDHQDDLERLTDIVTKRHQMQQQHDNPTPGLLDGYDTTKIPWHEQDMLHKNQHILDSDTLHRYLQKNHPESIRTAGAGGDLPEGLNFQAHDGWTHAYDGDTLIGYLRPHQNKIDMIKVHPEYRRRGIGTAMLNWHRDNVDPSIAHSTDQTPLGRAWGRSVGWNPPVWNRQDPDIDTLEDYEVERGPHTAARLAMPTYYHHTDDPDFQLDPGFVPENFAEDDEDYSTCPHCAADIDEDDPANWQDDNCPECGGSLSRSKPGVFVSDDPDRWASPYGEKRDYVADLDGPDLHNLPGVERVKDSGDNAYFVPADQFHHLKVKRVRPRTAARLAALPDGLHIQPEDDDWVAYHQGTPVGSLSVDYSTEVPSIDSIRVHPDYRRHGIGKALWEAAGRPAHTPDDMSADGQAWARSVGGPRLAMPAIDAYDDEENPDRGPGVPAGERVDHQDVRPGPYFHSTQNDFPPGHILVPRRELGMDDNPMTPNHSNWVWMSEHPADAHYHAGQGAHIYEVEPFGEGPWKWNKHPDWDDTEDGGNRYVSTRARIVRKIEPDENGEYYNWTPHTAARLAMPWYHNTDAELNPGDELLPPSETGHKSQFADADPEMGTIYHPDKVYFYKHPTEPTREEISDDHGPYSGTLDFGKNTYEVEPDGSYERDSEWPNNLLKWQGAYPYDDEIPGYHDYMADRARVVRRVEPKSDPSTVWGSPEYKMKKYKKKAKYMTAAVTVYTKPNCPQCTMTKKQLDRLGIEHRVIDVTVDPDAHAYVTGLGYQQAPVVVVGDGEQHWGGFSPDKLKGLVE
jgi:glutaredoxin-like protein NrdH